MPVAASCCSSMRSRSTIRSLLRSHAAATHLLHKPHRWQRPGAAQAAGARGQLRVKVGLALVVVVQNLMPRSVLPVVVLRRVTIEAVQGDALAQPQADRHPQQPCTQAPRVSARRTRNLGLLLRQTRCAWFRSSDCDSEAIAVKPH